MFAQKFSRNKVELRVRCLPRPLHSATPSPLYRKTFPTLFAILAEFVSAPSRRKSLEKRKSSGKITKKKERKNVQTFLHFISLPPRPRSRYSSRSKPPKAPVGHAPRRPQPPPLFALPTSVMRFHFTVTGSVHGKVSAFITEF